MRIPPIATCAPPACTNSRAPLANAGERFLTAHHGATGRAGAAGALKKRCFGRRSRRTAYRALVEEEGRKFPRFELWTYSRPWTWHLLHTHEAQPPRETRATLRALTERLIRRIFSSSARRQKRSHGRARGAGNPPCVQIQPAAAIPVCRVGWLLSAASIRLIFSRSPRGGRIARTEETGASSHAYH